jgi:hypothetical protein
MRQRIRLKEAERPSGMASAAILTEWRRGTIPVFSEDTKRGLSADDLIALLICIELRRQMPNNKEIAKKAKAAVAPTRQALAEYLDRGDMPTTVLITVFPPSGQALTYFVKSRKEIDEIQRDALEASLPVQIVPLTRIISEVAQAFELTPAAPMPEHHEQPPRAPQPGIPVERIDIAEPRTGPHASLSGLSVFLDGQGLRARLSAANWRDFAKQADVIADALEQPPQQPGLTIERVDFDEPVTGARWSPEGLVFCLAGRGLRLRTSAASWKSFAGEAAAFAAARGQPTQPPQHQHPEPTARQLNA